MSHARHLSKYEHTVCHLRITRSERKLLDRVSIAKSIPHSSQFNLLRISESAVLATFPNPSAVTRSTTTNHRAPQKCSTNHQDSNRSTFPTHAGSSADVLPTVCFLYFSTRDLSSSLTNTAPNIQITLLRAGELEWALIDIDSSELN